MARSWAHNDNWQKLWTRPHHAIPSKLKLAHDTSSTFQLSPSRTCPWDLVPRLSPTDDYRCTAACSTCQKNWIVVSLTIIPLCKPNPMVYGYFLTWFNNLFFKFHDFRHFSLLNLQWSGLHPYQAWKHHRPRHSMFNALLSAIFSSRKHFDLAVQENFRG